LLRSELNRGGETIPHIPDPRELPQLIPQNPAVLRRVLRCALVDFHNN
jgi:hypothetical protein